MWLVPFGAVVYFPASVLLGRRTWAWAFTCVPAALVTAAISSLVWRVGVNKYQGVGH